MFSPGIYSSSLHFKNSWINRISIRMVWFSDQRILFIILKTQFFIFFLYAVCVAKTNWKMETFYRYINIVIYSHTNDILLRITKKKQKKLMLQIVDILNIFHQTKDVFHLKLNGKVDEFIWIWRYFAVQITKQLSTYFDKTVWSRVCNSKMNSVLKTLEVWSKE